MTTTLGELLADLISYGDIHEVPIPYSHLTEYEKSVEEGDVDVEFRINMAAIFIAAVNGDDLKLVSARRGPIVAELLRQKVEVPDNLNRGDYP